MLTTLTTPTNNLMGIDIGLKHCYAVELVKSGLDLIVRSCAYGQLGNLTQQAVATSIALMHASWQVICLSRRLTSAQLAQFMQLNMSKYLQRPVAELVVAYSATPPATVQLVAVDQTIIQQQLNWLRPYYPKHKIIDLDIYAIERIARRQLPKQHGLVAAINIDLVQLLLIVIDTSSIVYAHAARIEHCSEHELITMLLVMLNNLPYQIEQILLAGQQNIQSNILLAMTRRLNIPSKKINPFVGMKIMPSFDCHLAPALALSCGLALRVNDVRWD